METPYGEIPEKFLKDMSRQDMCYYMKARHSRRRFLKGAAATGALAVAGPIFWRQTYAAATTVASAPGSQWIAYGPDPSSEMWISWNAGNASTAANVPSPVVRSASARTTARRSLRPAGSSRRPPVRRAKSSRPTSTH